MFRPAVRDVVRRRLARLPDEAVSLLALAAVIGREFDFDVLCKSSGSDDEEVLDVVEAGLLLGVIVEDDTPSTYKFSHSLVRDTLYRALSAVRRIRLHRRVGEAIEGLSARPTEAQHFALAHHFAAAAPGGDVAKAIQYSTLVGDSALRHLAYEEAGRRFGQAISVHRVVSG